MKKKLLLILVLGLGLNACNKELEKGHKNILETKDIYISLEDAIKQETEKITPYKRPLEKYSSIKVEKKLSNNNVALTLPINCSSYPDIIDFRQNNSLKCTGENTNQGGGLALRYKFKKGKTYIIKFSMSKVNNYNTDDGVTSIQTFPKLQVGMANDLNFPSVCSSYVNLASLNIPHDNVPDVKGQNRNMKSNAEFTENSSSRSITLVADECYDYLWFNAIPTPGKYNVNFGISFLQITEVPQNFSFAKTGDFNDVAGSVFKVVYNGFVVDHAFEWSTTGNLAIIGNNVGNTVTVKSTNQKPIKGKVIASIPGCGIFAEQVFDGCSGDVFVNGVIYGPTFLYTHYHNNNDQEFTLVLNPGETFTIMHLISDRSQVELWRSGNTFKLRIPPGWVFANSPYQDYFTISIKGIDSNGCEKYISKGITVYPAPGTGDPNGPQVPDY